MLVISFVLLLVLGLVVVVVGGRLSLLPPSRLSLARTTSRLVVVAPTRPARSPGSTRPVSGGSGPSPGS